MELLIPILILQLFLYLERKNVQEQMQHAVDMGFPQFPSFVFAEYKGLFIAWEALYYAPFATSFAFILMDTANNKLVGIPYLFAFAFILANKKLQEKVQDLIHMPFPYIRMAVDTESLLAKEFLHALKAKGSYSACLLLSREITAQESPEPKHLHLLEQVFETAHTHDIALVLDESLHALSAWMERSMQNGEKNLFPSILGLFSKLAAKTMEGKDQTERFTLTAKSFCEGPLEKFAVKTKPAVKNFLACLDVVDFITKKALENGQKGLSKALLLHCLLPLVQKYYHETPGETEEEKFCRITILKHGHYLLSVYVQHPDYQRDTSVKEYLEEERGNIETLFKEFSAKNA